MEIKLQLLHETLFWDSFDTSPRISRRWKGNNHESLEPLLYFLFKRGFLSIFYFLKAWLTSLKICAFFINSSFLRSSLSSFFLQLEISLQGLVFWNSIHLEVASDSFCFLINSSWLLVFILYVFFMIFSGFNLYCWKGIHFSQNNFLYFLLLFLGLIFNFHFWHQRFIKRIR